MSMYRDWPLAPSYRWDVYLIGSLRQPERIHEVHDALEAAGLTVFTSWLAAGPEADDYWKTYEQRRGRTYREALQAPAARHVYAFDRENLDASRTAVLALPAGRSGHLELGFHLGRGRPGYILLDDPDRWDVMYQFATGVYDHVEALVEAAKLK